MKDITWKIKSFEELSTQELYAILKVRQEVFMIEQTCYYLDADGYDEKHYIFCRKRRKNYCLLQNFSQNIKYPETSIGRVLTHPEFRNLQLGKNLIKFALETIETEV